MSLNNIVHLDINMDPIPVYSIEANDYVTNLAQWRVYECKIKGRAEPARHLNGRNLQYSEGRVSSAVQSWELTDKGIRCVTKSGNVYMLVGHPGHNRDAEYVFGVWRHSNSAKDLNDVTDEYYDYEQGKPKLPV